MIKIDRIYRDKMCNYCKVSNARYSNDNRAFYTISNIEGGAVVISICEYCARELIKQLSETIESE